MNLQEKNMLIYRYAKGKENSLVDSYITDGPAALQEKLDLSDEQWIVIFDYMVFEHNLLYKAVANSVEFFLNEYIKHGNIHIRDILAISDAKYDVIYELIFDFIAISNEGLYYHVLENRDRYMVAFKARGGDFVRKVLGVWKDKYEENWLQILDVLLHAVCDAIFTEQTFEHGLEAFSKIINGTREHRSLDRTQKFRAGVI